MTRPACWTKTATPRPWTKADLALNAEYKRHIDQDIDVSEPDYDDPNTECDAHAMLNHESTKAKCTWCARIPDIAASMPIGLRHTGTRC